MFWTAFPLNSETCLFNTEHHTKSQIQYKSHLQGLFFQFKFGGHIQQEHFKGAISDSSLFNKAKSSTQHKVSMTTKQVLLPLSSASVSVRVHPVALFSICDAYIRRNKDQERVIGTLLGSIVENVYEVKSCYVVPHTETGDQVAVDVQHHNTMFELHQRVSSSDVILGWFATGKALYNSDSLYQEFYKGQASSTAIHLKVDTTLTDRKLSVTAYQSRTLALTDRQVALEFVEVPCEVLFAAVERAGVELLTAVPGPKPLSDADSLAQSLARLEQLLEAVHNHVSEVVAGKKAGDPALGRYLADTLAVVPRLGRGEFERMFNDSVQDGLMVSYLANLLRAQVALAERLGTGQLPIWG